MAGCLNNESIKSINQEAKDINAVIIDNPDEDIKIMKDDGQSFYGDVYYKGNLIAESQELETPEGQVPNQIHYIEAKISPNSKFIYLLSDRWEYYGIEIYETDSGKKYDANVADSHVTWLSDSRLQIEGPCLPMTECGLFQSTSSEKPWEIEKIE